MIKPRPPQNSRIFDGRGQRQFELSNRKGALEAPPFGWGYSLKIDAFGDSARGTTCYVLELIAFFVFATTQSQPGHPTGTRATPAGLFETDNTVRK